MNDTYRNESCLTYLNESCLTSMNESCLTHVLQVKGQEEQVTDGQLIMFGDVECTLSAPVRHAGLFCGNLGLFCRQIGLFCGNIGMYY